MDVSESRTAACCNIYNGVISVADRHNPSFYARLQNCEKRLLASSCCPSVCPFTWNNSAPNERIFMKFYIRGFFENLSRLLTFNWNRPRNKGTVHEAQYMCIYIYLYRIFSNLIRTRFCRFLKRKKKLVRGSNPHISFNFPLPTRQTDWIILDDNNALTVIRLTRRVWSSDWVTDNDSVMSDDGESDEQ